MYFWQNFWTLNQTDNFTSNYKRILFLCKIFKYVFSTFHNRMSLPLYSEKYAWKWRGAIFIGRRWTDKIRSLSVRRKFQFVFDGRDAEESSYRCYWNAPCSSLFLSRQPNEAANEVGRRRKYSKNHYRRNFHTFRNSLGKAFNPREEKMRRSEGERGRRRLKRQKEQGHERAAFRFPHHFAPFTEGRAPRKGWLTALIVPVVTVYSDFHPVFFTRFLPLFFQLNPPTRQFK